jgi:ubiquinone/menaquinone biosynthesis C-methylase UbiE
MKMAADSKDQNRLNWDPQNVFLGTARFYARYRPGYPDTVIDLLRKKFSLGQTSRVLDLGCGTGQIALHIAPYAGEIVAIDPMEEMLDEGRQLAVIKGIHNIEWIESESSNLPHLLPHIGEVTLTVMARSFHWMYREQTLRDLYGMTRPSGGIAIINDSWPGDGSSLPWKDIINQTVIRWLGKERKAGTDGTYSHPAKRFEEVIRESAFQNLEIANHQTERWWSLDQIIGYLYSTSFSSLPLLGDKKEAFETDLRARLLATNPEAQFKEDVTINIMMAWKPPEQHR